MTETAKPLWWKTRKGKVWHLNHPADTPFVGEVIAGHIRGLPICELPSLSGYTAFYRRTAPPVAQQCKRCRAAKAKQRKEKVTV